MKNLLTILLTILSLFLVASGQAPRPTMALRHVTLVDATDGSLRPNHTVLVTGNRITAVGPSDRIRTPDGAKLVDGAGGFFIPGLWDMHVHSAANAGCRTGRTSIGSWPES